jgi:hypothetical protein
VEEQKSINQKIAKLNHSIEVCRLFGVVDAKQLILDLAFQQVPDPVLPQTYFDTKNFCRNYLPV